MGKKRELALAPSNSRIVVSDKIARRVVIRLKRVAWHRNEFHLYKARKTELG